MKTFFIIIMATLIFTYGYGQSDTLLTRKTSLNMEHKNSHSDSNKAFLQMLISKRLPLTDYPEKVSKDFVVYEPASLPFGGKYSGLTDYYALAPQLTAYYDYSRFELTGIYADGDAVFVTLKVGLKKSEKHILLCEQFTFKEEKIEEIKIFILD